MELKLSRFGQRLAAHTGINELMDDLGRAMAGAEPVIMLGGGNPAAVPGANACFRRLAVRLVQDKRAFETTVGNYDVPQGRPGFIEAVCSFFNRCYGWELGPGNIAVTNGSQTAYFYLFNMLAGSFPDGSFKRILFPLMPEYIGYADQALEPRMFTAVKPAVDFLEDRTFKYRVNFDKLRVTEDIAAIVASRPTNPTGNVLTDREVARLLDLARSRNIPLILDNAYGSPFPQILFTKADPPWDRNVILTYSISKLGLPGVRTGLVIGPEELVSALSRINAVVGLASGNVGPELLTPLFKSGQIAELSRRIIRPFYAERAAAAALHFRKCLDPGLPVYLHRCEGSLFLWIWCKDLPVAGKELYRRLKERGVLTVPGSYFFFGLPEPWRHAEECIRVNYAHDPEEVRLGLEVLAQELARAYREA